MKQSPPTRHMLFDHDPGPPEIQVDMITIETTDNNEFEAIMKKQELEEYSAYVETMYKRKDKKILPANVPLPDGVNPGGGVNLESSARSTGKVVPHGSRLTPERLTNMKIGTGFLSDAEKQLFIDILFEHEGAIAFDDSEMGLRNPEIQPPVIKHTIPQGWTNSVSSFQHVMGKVYWHQIPHHDHYNDKEISPAIRRFVYEHVQIFCRFIHDCWKAGLTISGAKSAIGMCGINIVGFMFDNNGRQPEYKKEEQ